MFTFIRLESLSKLFANLRSHFVTRNKLPDSKAWAFRKVEDGKQRPKSKYYKQGVGSKESTIRNEKQGI